MRKARSSTLSGIRTTLTTCEELSDSLIAAVIFASGVACKQVFTASSNYGSGTFAVDQAYAAYKRFGFTNCLLYREPEPEMFATLISNLQAGYPAHLAVENNAGTSGHNVVVDGYRESDGKFHVNFGWGGYRDNWYNLPCEVVDYAIFNTLGQMVTAGSTDGSISVSDLQKGVYVLQIKGAKLVETVKFVMR